MAEIDDIRARAGIYPSPQAQRDVEWLLGEIERLRASPSPPPDGVEGLVEALVHDLVGELNTAFMTCEAYGNDDYEVRIRCRDLQTAHAVYELILMLGIIVKKQPLPSWAIKRLRLDDVRLIFEGRDTGLAKALELLCDEIEMSLPDDPQEFTAENIWRAYRQARAVLAAYRGRET